jgi:hypothetical protein
MRTLVCAIILLFIILILVRTNKVIKYSRVLKIRGIDDFIFRAVVENFYDLILVLIYLLIINILLFFYYVIP